MTSETPHLALLDRNQAVIDIKIHFSDNIFVIKDLSNYCTMLIMRLLSKGVQSIDQYVVIASLFQHELIMFDSVETQLSKGNVTSAQLQARSMLETSLFIDWILKDETTFRAKCYYVGHHRKHKWTLEKFIQQINAETEVSGKIKEMSQKTAGVPDDMVPSAQIELDSINNILSSAAYSEVNEQFLSMVTSRGQEPDWYKVTGVSSVAKIAKKVERELEYYIFYNNYSKLMHGASLDSYSKIDDELLQLASFRDLTMFDSLFTNVLSVMFG